MTSNTNKKAQSTIAAFRSQSLYRQRNLHTFVCLTDEFAAANEDVIVVDFYLDVACILTLVKHYGLYKGNILAALKSTYTLCNFRTYDVREGEGLTSICESYCHHNKHKEGQASKDIISLYYYTSSSKSRSNVLTTKDYNDKTTR